MSIHFFSFHRLVTFFFKKENLIQNNKRPMTNKKNEQEEPYFVWFENNLTIKPMNRYTVNFSQHRFRINRNVRSRYPLMQTLSKDNYSRLSNISYFEVNVEKLDEYYSFSIGLVDKHFDQDDRIGNSTGNYYAVTFPGTHIFLFFFCFNPQRH
ncbi:hypothetical protein M0813_04178 [Anaeramoeba flamelloides]|uniref:Uncharacterized protein n=1 Tax=Anaeramoeba flamelloides TaxID=1746091 RepID=A0ABQ8XL35_9EUKA|nr:hypothetical protein M0813_04178 [Anaeramoeba flamelloides]